ncbi:hypothetical protein [Clostridium lundense]|uniref:hypothetical protein n=1 Tax=Clostridium lundense TaxID=319475 RepID=UPI000488DF02|nr:hypothetical protein [Clostridium lundense]
MNIKALALGIIITVCSGCSTTQAITPTSVISPPKGNIIKSEGMENLKSMVNISLPKGAKMLEPITPQGTPAIQVKDLQGDGIDEIVAVSYRVGDSENEVRIAIFRKEENKLIQIADVKGEGYTIDRLSFEDIDGDGQKEILFGWKVGSMYNVLDVYKLQNKELKKLVSTEYSKLEVGNFKSNTSENKKVEFAIWMKDTGDSYKIDIFRWNGKNLIKAEDVYSDYFNKVVIPYYTEKVKEMPKAAFYWYYLGDAQIKAGQKKEALKSIEKGMSLNLEYPSKEEFLKLKKLAEN